MKKIILTMAAVFAVSFANAQDKKGGSSDMKFGVKAGYVNANYGSDANDGDPRSGFYLGGLVDFSVSEKFHVQPELLYTMEGNGETDFDLNFVKIYEPKSPSYEVSYEFDVASGEELLQALDDLKALTIATYQIKKNQDNTFSIKDANGEEITNDVEAVKSKNDILVYDILFKKSVLLKNFYNDEVKIGEWYNMEELPSPTGLYWIFSETPEFFVIQNGVLLDMSLYKLVKTQKEDDFIVQEAGIDKYIIRDLNSKGFETFYPLEFLNN